jgi:hypothetical protein
MHATSLASNLRGTAAMGDLGVDDITARLNNLCLSSCSWVRYYASSQKVAGSILDEAITFFNLPNPSSLIMGLGSTQSLTEISTKNLPGGKMRPAPKADNLTAICEPIF